MTIRRTLPTRKVREVNAPRSAPITTDRPSPRTGRDVLNRRRNVVQEGIAGRIQAAKESDADVIEIPDDADILSDIIDRARNDIRHRRPGAYVHVSDLIGKCLRRMALLERHELPARASKLGIMDLITFRVGDAIHDVIKERAAAGGSRMVWGRWKCSCGHLHHEEPCLFSEIDMEDICEHCATPTTQYEEVPMRDEDLMIVGTPDLLLYLAQFDAFHVTELKSISHDQWTTLARPKPEHVIQVLFYWYLMRKLGYRVTNRASILYVTKGYIFNGKPYKEFVIDCPDNIARLDDFLEEARWYKIAREGGELPPRTYCAHEDCGDAKKCEVSNICFGEHDATIKTVNIDALFGQGNENGVRPLRIARSRS